MVTPSESNRVTFRPDVNNGLPKLTTPPSFSASQNTDSQKLVLFSSSQTPASIGSSTPLLLVHATLSWSNFSYFFYVLVLLRTIIL